MKWLKRIGLGLLGLLVILWLGLVSE